MQAQQSEDVKGIAVSGQHSDRLLRSNRVVARPTSSTFVKTKKTRALRAHKRKAPSRDANRDCSGDDDIVGTFSTKRQKRESVEQVEQPDLIPQVQPTTRPLDDRSSIGGRGNTFIARSRIGPDCVELDDAGILAFECFLQQVTERSGFHFGNFRSDKEASRYLIGFGRGVLEVDKSTFDLYEKVFELFFAFRLDSKCVEFDPKLEKVITSWMLKDARVFPLLRGVLTYEDRCKLNLHPL